MGNFSQFTRQISRQGTSIGPSENKPDNSTTDDTDKHGWSDEAEQEQRHP
jgi:hypothetical protein